MPTNRKPGRRVIRLSVLLALVVSSLPLAVAAQQTGKVWRIGVLSALSPDAPRWAPFRDRLRNLGYAEGQNIVLEWRASGGRAERFPGLAAELVQLKVDVIVAGDNPAIAAAQKATKTIPIVMVLAMDPVASGFAHSLARPSGNLRGLTAQGTDLQGKTLQVLKEALPTASRVGILWDPTEPGRHVQAKEAEGAARALGLQGQLVEARGPGELDRVFAAMAREKLDAVKVQPSQMIFAHRARIAERDQYDRAARYVAKILSGTNPGDLPIEQVMRFELKVNLKTARRLGLTVPQSLLLQANLIIE